MLSAPLILIRRDPSQVGHADKPRRLKNPENYQVSIPLALQSVFQWDETERQAGPHPLGV